MKIFNIIIFFLINEEIIKNLMYLKIKSTTKILLMIFNKLIKINNHKLMQINRKIKNRKINVNNMKYYLMKT